MASPHQNPLVSVIVPVYNGEDFIVPAVESALRQTYTHLEILIVDDGSTDNTLALLRELAARDSRIRVLTQANAGVAAARNHAIAESRGDFVAPLDADDLWLPEKIELQLDILLHAGEGTGFVYCWWAWVDERGHVLDRSPRWAIGGEVLTHLIFINFVGNASVPLFRKSALLEAGGYDPTLAANKAGGCEDWQLLLRIASLHRVSFVPEILVGYRRRPGSMSTALDTMWRSKERVMAGIRTLRPDIGPALFRASEHNFQMYLAGLAFASGNRVEAFRRGLRAGVRLPLLVFPYVLRMLLHPRPPINPPIVIEPGVPLNADRIPDPLLPYDQIRGFLPAQSLQ